MRGAASVSGVWRFVGPGMLRRSTVFIVTIKILLLRSTISLDIIFRKCTVYHPPDLADVDVL